MSERAMPVQLAEDADRLAKAIYGLQHELRDVFRQVSHDGCEVEFVKALEHLAEPKIRP